MPNAGPSSRDCMSIGSAGARPEDSWTRDTSCCISSKVIEAKSSMERNPPRDDIAPGRAPLRQLARVMAPQTRQEPEKVAERTAHLGGLVEYGGFRGASAPEPEQRRTEEAAAGARRRMPAEGAAWTRWPLRRGPSPVARAPLAGDAGIHQTKVTGQDFEEGRAPGAAEGAGTRPGGGVGIACFACGVHGRLRLTPLPNRRSRARTLRQQHQTRRRWAAPCAGRCRRGRSRHRPRARVCAPPTGAAREHRGN